MAEQLTVTNGPRATLESSWRRRGHELFPGAALAENEHGGRCGRYPFDGVEHAPDSIGLADERAGSAEAADFRIQVQVLTLQAMLLERLLDDVPERVDLVRLGDEVLGAGFDGVDGRLQAGIRRDHDDGRRRRHLHDLGERGHSVHLGHAQIEQDEVDGFAARGRRGTLSRCRIR